MAKTRTRRKAAKTTLPKPRSSKPRTTRSAGTTTTTRSRRGQAKGGQRSVTRSHSVRKPSLSGGAQRKSTTRKATVKTKGGLTRTAKTSKTTTGSGANRVTKSTRTITRTRPNGRKVVRKVTRVNRGGKVTVERSKPKVTGGLAPATHKPMARKKVSNPGVKHNTTLGGNADHQARKAPGIRNARIAHRVAASTARKVAKAQTAPKAKKRRRR
jgi:hypothetical protein